ncbi:hypothetical protein REPUB_Repub05bG0054800 [Reevesia pubescens]
MVFCYHSLEQIKNVKRVLKYFQVISGLKVNLQKSSLYGIEVDENLVKIWAKVIFYKSVNKVRKVRTFGSWVDGVWVWNIQLHRSLFDWEFEQWNNLLLAISDFSLARNDIVFNKKVFDLVQTICLIKYRVAAWLKAKWTNLKTLFEDIFRFLNLVVAPVQFKKPRIATNWSPPFKGFVKFNVDGSTIGKPGLAGIGGVLCDEFGVRLLVFSKAIRISDSNEAEFIAINEAFSMFVSSPWSKVYGLIVDSDSQVAVKWFNCHDSMPWKLRKFCSFIDSLKGAVIRWKVQLVYRESNDIADGLAKAGVYRTDNLTVYLG